MAKQFMTFKDDKSIDRLIFENLTKPGKVDPDAELDATIDFARDPVDEHGNAKEFEPIIIWDTVELGLRLRIGRTVATWQWFSQSQDHNKRKHVFKTLGRFDSGHHFTGINANPHAWQPPTHRAHWHMGIEAARKQARIYGGKVLEGSQGPNAKAGPTFRQAFGFRDADGNLVGGFKNADGDDVTGYLQYLQTTCKATSKWPYNVERLGEALLLPQWGDWSLIEMANRRVAFKSWYMSLSKNPTNANHAARIVRAMYKRAAAMDNRLPSTDPTAAIGRKDWHKEAGAQKAADPRLLHEWYEALQQIPNATHRAYHLVALLTGARPGELGRAKWRHLDLENREFTMPDAKEENDIVIPISNEIIAAFELARTDPKRPDPERTTRRAEPVINKRLGPNDPIFPGCENNPTRDVLPARGHALRRTYRSIAKAWCKIDPDIAEFLEGRAPPGVSARYLPDWVVRQGPEIIKAQEKISRTIMALCKGKKLKRAA